MRSIFLYLFAVFICPNVIYMPSLLADPETPTEPVQPNSELGLPPISEEQEVASLDVTGLIEIGDPSSVPFSPSASTDIPDPLIAQPYYSPTIAASLSSVIPGLGQLYIREPSRSGAFFGTRNASLANTAYARKELEDQERVPEESLNKESATQFCSVYTAYRDARILNGEGKYQYKMPQDSIEDMTYACFSYATLSKPEVWGGVLGMLCAGFLIASLSPEHIALSSVASTNGSIFPLAAFPVAIGEEAYFRGFLQPAVMEKTNPAVAIVLSSATFGLAHAGNALSLPVESRSYYYRVVIPYLSTAGAYLGWLAHRGSLKEATAVHAWYDFTLFALDYFLADPELSTAKAAIPKEYSLSLSF